MERSIASIVQDGDLGWWKFANVYSQATFAHWLGQRQAQGIEPQSVAPTREQIKLAIVDYPIRDPIDPACADATLMSYEDWREIYGPDLAVGQDEARRPYAY